MVWPKDFLVPNVIFELRPDSESSWEGTSDESIRFGYKVPKVDLQLLLSGFVIWPKDSLVLIQPWHQGIFGPDHPFEREDNTLKHTLKAI